MSKKCKGKKVKCPACGRLFRLNTMGVIRSHSVDRSSMFRTNYAPQCKGTYKDPTPT